MNATERIRAALQKTAEARHPGELPPLPTPPEPQTSAPVESTLRLISADDAGHATLVRPAADPPPQEPQDRGPAQTVELLRSSLAPANLAPAAPVRPAPVVEDDDAATELRMWAADVPAKRRKISWIWIALAALLVVVAVVATVFRRAWLPGTSTPAVTALQLGVESEDNGLISLRWNPQSVPVTQARDGHLSIVEDQKPPRIVPLSAGQLAAGHLFYESSSDRVEFQLEVVEKSGTVVKESAIAAKKPEPVTDAQAPAVQTPQQGAAINQTAQNPAAPGDPVTETPKPATRTFTPPPTPARREEQPGEGRVILMEPAPALAGGSTVPAGAMLPERVNIISPPQAAAPPRTAPQPAAKPAQRVQVGGNLQSAMLLRKVEPAYPTMARQMRIQGLVRFQAVIGKDGEVQDLKFISGPRVLERAASDAVKHWVYRPTLLNGRPVEVSTQIDINFTLGN